MKFKIIIVLLLVILTIGAVSAADDNISSDNLTADEDLQLESSIEQEDILSGNAGTFSELSTKIKNTPQNTILKLDKDYVNTNTKEGIVISKSITIDGNGHAIDADKKSNIFKVESSNVTLKNIVFKNGLEDNTYIDGHYYYNGGAIYFIDNFKNNIISNCTFRDCSARNGGAICINGDENTIIDCNFINCACEYQGGAISIFPDYYFDYGHHNNIKNCSFIDCSSKYDGGAIYICGMFDNIIDCDFINCNAKNSGAIHFQNSDIYLDGGHRWDNGCSNCDVKNCKFINCFASNNGGAISRYDESDNGINNCSFINCSAKNMGGSIYFYDIYETDDGIGIFIYYGSRYNKINNCIFINCIADCGGGIYFGDDSNYGSVNTSNFINCSAKNGGAIFINESIESLVIECDFENNTADELGGAVYGAIVSNCTFRNNSDPQHYNIYTPTIFTEKNPRPDSEPISITMHKSVSGNFSAYISYENDNYTFVGTSDIINGSAEVNYKYTKLGKYKIKAIINTNYGTFESYANTTVKCIRFDEYNTIDGYYADFENNQIYVNLPDDANGNFSVYVSSDSKNYELYESINISKYNKIINFKPEKAGTYYLMAIYDGNYGFENATANITYEQLKDQSSIKASNANVFYNDNGKYSLEVSDFDGYINYGNPVSVKIANTVFKKSPTFEGLVTVNIPKLKPGTYKITISYNTKYRNLTATKKLTVKHIVTLKTVKVKKSAKKLTLQATLKNKKAIKGKTVTFKFNGKTYKAKTDKKGIAKVTIKSSVLKKLKVGKKVTCQATYLKDTVKKTVKVQR